MMGQMFCIGERSGLQAGPFSTWTLLLRSHAVVIPAVCGLHCPAEIHKAYPEIDVVWRGAYVSSACLVSCWSVVFGSRHSCLEFRFRVGVRTLTLHVLSHCVCVRSRVRSAVRSSVHVCFVVLHAVRVFIGCVHSCYLLCCVARSLCIHWLRAFMLSCLV